MEPRELSTALRAVLRVIMTGSPILFVAIVAQPGFARRGLAIIVAVYSLCIPAFVLNTRGHTRAASSLLVAGLWGIITMCAVTAGATAALAPWFYVIFVLVTGLFFGARAGAGAAMLAVATSLTLTILEVSGWIPWGPLPYTPMLRWAVLALVLAFMAGLQWFAARTIGDAFAQIRQQVANGERAAEHLRRTMERSDTLVHSIDGIVWEADATTFRFTFVSPQAERILGYPCTRWLLEPLFWKDHIHPDDRDDTVAYCVSCTAQMRAHDFEYRMFAADGREVWIRDIVSVEAEDGRPKTLRGIMVDITERKLAETAARASEDQLRALSARLESAREEEGRRIAREIHDELGGTLAALKWDLDGVARTVSGAMEAGEFEHIRRKVPAMLDLVESTMNAVRRIAADLRPAVLDDLGVIAAIEWQVRQFEARTGIECVCDTADGASELDRERATAVFRILQEILTNVLRHAEASRVRVQIRRELDTFVLDVRDNGRGIGEDKLGGQRSLGLLGMRERALLAGGDVRIQGVAGSGTTVLVKIPLASMAPAETANV